MGRSGRKEHLLGQYNATVLVGLERLRPIYLGQEECAQFVMVVLRIDGTLLIALELLENDRHHGAVGPGLDAFVEERCIEEGQVEPLHVIQQLHELPLIGH